MNETVKLIIDRQTAANLRAEATRYGLMYGGRPSISKLVELLANNPTVLAEAVTVAREKVGTGK